MTLTEDLISQDSEQDVTRLLLSMQEIIATIRYISGLILTFAIFQHFPSHDLECPHPMCDDQLVTHCNQVWLDKVVRSRALHMIVTSSASSVIEVEPELQGNLVLALDPLSLSPGAGGLATSSFAVWRRAPTSLEDPEDHSSVLRPSDQLCVGGLAVFGHQTRVILAGRGGVSEYILDRRLGGLVTSPTPSQPQSSDTRPLIRSLPRSESSVNSELSELVSRATSRLSSSISEVVTSRTGLAGVDCLGVITQGGLWLSDGLGLLYHATPLALIGWHKKLDNNNNNR